MKSKDSISIISAILFLILGTLLVTDPNGFVQFVAYILGGIIVVLGIVKLVTYFRNKEEIDNNNNLIIAITLMVVGIITMFLSSAIEFVIRLVVGGWLLYNGIIKLVLALKLKEAGIAPWYITLISSIIMLICGLYTIVFVNVFGIAAGVVLIVYSIAEIIQYIMVPKPKNNDIVK